MFRTMKPLLASILALSAGLALAAPGGQISALPMGDFICELPGDATGPAGVHQAEEDFTVVNATTYTNFEGRGSYLLTGTRIVMTSGPKQGEKYHRISANFLRKLAPDGSDSTLRCIRRVTNNR